MPTAKLRKLRERSASRSVSDGELRAAMEQYEASLERSRSAIWEVDKRGIFTYVSRSLEKLIGYSRKELVGKRHIDSFYPESMEPQLAEELASSWLAREAPFFNAECPLRHKKGHIVWVASHGFPFFDKRGRLLGYRGTDIAIVEPTRHNGAASQDSESPAATALESLAFRVRQVLWGVAHGLLNKQIAARCGLSDPTVKFYRTSLTRKLGIASAAGLALFAREAGLTNVEFPAGPFYG